MAAKTSSKPELTSAFTLFNKSTEIVVKNWKLFALLYILPFLASIPDATQGDKIANPFSGLTGSSLATTIIAVAGVFIAIGFVLFVNQAMLFVLELQTSSGKTPTLGAVWQKTKDKLWRLLGLFILITLIITAGLIAFIIPGIIFIRRYFLAPYYLLDKNLSISEAMKQSAASSKPNSSYIWSVIGVSILLSLPAAIPKIGWLISLVLLALYSVAPALRYQEIKKLS